MKTAIANQTYAVLQLDGDMDIVKDGSDDAANDIDQLIGDELELWKTREDGFHFVFCNRMEIGYWVNPHLVNVK